MRGRWKFLCYRFFTDEVTVKVPKLPKAKGESSLWGARGKERADLQSLVRALSRVDEQDRKLLTQHGAGDGTTWSEPLANPGPPSYRTIPISLAASSQTQIGSTPFWNFCQRLSQSILGTKQLNVDGTDSGPPFLSHTRNRAGCSPSFVQEVGLRITSLHGL